MSGVKVTIAGIDTATLPVLTHQQMMVYFKQYQVGDLAAKEELVLGNLRLVLSLVQRFAGRGESPEDLFQVGCVGLIKAIQNFDLKHQVRFSTYAVPMIIGEMKRHLREKHPLRIARSLRDIAYQALTAREELIREFGYEPTIKDIAARLERKEEDVLFALDALHEPMSLHEPLHQDSGESVYFMDQLKDNNTSEDLWTTFMLLKERLKHLSSRQLQILQQRIFHGATQVELATRFNLSQAQVSRLEKSAYTLLQSDL
ncbi:sigma-70 family RNA polymerase sigma factor [Chryseomicrobium sp. FSL W7-1435]|uniref:sigma-70 family RNA polymerase sigma factor n=1 Tax=Chryseomicrobium sp. FSL W7-1435 TaxID=2921704 RepID=UPI00315B33E2